ncbi:DivIVA domain-containing protein [Micromonospora chaiyaphumensis]|uniref:DivIVA domain-containing protein n=1 Tax=Micromonospora chaiyaphumensis TaxID=307119 RepID=A0A1C4VN14_9ACTN|nr:DivIVA domain-containing protein [Micromonospora chaiyaphumensis]SCE85353.1 DivIVA domain-containing protein [Micromonospora chaiyaphumensis]
MRNLIRRLSGRRDESQPPIQATRGQPLRPWQIRERCFNVRRRGLDPVEIRTFLHQVADELTVAQTALRAVQEENVRIKNALRSWQSAQSANHRYR